VKPTESEFGVLASRSLLEIHSWSPGFSFGRSISIPILEENDLICADCSLIYGLTEVCLAYISASFGLYCTWETDRELVHTIYILLYPF
jgi:hypothetical protein